MPKMPSTTLSRGEIILLCEKHYATHSASQIAAMIGSGMTRGAVTGIWRRRGLKDKQTRFSSPPPPRRPRPAPKSEPRRVAQAASSSSDSRQASPHAVINTAKTPIATASHMPDTSKPALAAASSSPPPSRMTTGQGHMDLMRPLPAPAAIRSAATRPATPSSAAGFRWPASHTARSSIGSCIHPDKRTRRPMPNLNFKSCTPDEAKQIIRVISTMPEAIRPSIMLHGDPGSGKSGIVKQIAEERYDGVLIDFRAALIDGTDVKGMPFPDRETQRTVYYKPDCFPKQGKGVFFVDEVNQARRDVMAALYPILLDRKIDDYTFPDDWLMIAAGNDIGDGAIANDMGTALNDRLLHRHIVQTPQSFLAWHENRGMHPAVLTLVQQMPHLLSNNAQRIEKDLIAAPTARSWERASNVLKHCQDQKLDRRLTTIAISGEVGSEAASHLELTLKDMAECADPFKLMKTSLSEIPDLLPTTVRAGVALAFALHSIAETPEDLVKAAGILQLMAIHRKAKDLTQTVENGAPMNGSEIAALGIEKLLGKAEANDILDAVLETPAPGSQLLHDYIESVQQRHAA